jgi:hypothetical protein
MSRLRAISVALAAAAAAPLLFTGQAAAAEQQVTVADHLTCPVNQEVEIALGWVGRILHVRIGPNSNGPYYRTYTYDGGFASNSAVIRTGTPEVRWEAVATGTNQYDPPSGPLFQSVKQRCVAP